MWVVVVVRVSVEDSKLDCIWCVSAQCLLMTDSGHLIGLELFHFYCTWMWMRNSPGFIW